jgi:glucose-1-phosphate thymidylyltransferase
LPVKDKPLANHILDRVSQLDDLTEIYVVTNNKFVSHFQEWADQLSLSVPVTVINDGTNSPEDRLGSIGDIAYVLNDQNPDEDILVVGGDNLFNFNLDDFIASAKPHPTAVTIGLYDIGNIEEATKFGVVAIDDGGKVTSFEEKPQQPKSSLVAMCFYYFPRGSLTLVDDYLAAEGKADRAGDYIRWLHDQHEVYGFQFTGKWFDIGSVESYYEAQDAF